MQILAGTASDVCWGRIYIQCTEAFSVLEMFQDDTLYNWLVLNTSSGGSKNVEKGGGGRQFISSVLICRKCAQRNICILHGKKQAAFFGKIWAYMGVRPPPPSRPLLNLPLLTRVGRGSLKLVNRSFSFCLQKLKSSTRFLNVVICCL